MKDRTFEVFMDFDLSLKIYASSILIIDESACTLNITKSWKEVIIENFVPQKFPAVR